MSTITLAELREQIRNEADMKNVSFITDSELNSYINASITELHDLLVSKYGDDYYLKSSSLVLPNGEKELTLPSDFLKMRGLDLVEGSNRMAIKRFDFKQRNLKGCLRYRTMGNKIIFTDNQKYGDKNIELWYVPKASKLSSDSDTLDGFNGWEEYVIVDCAIKCLSKEESDVSEPERVVNVRNHSGIERSRYEQWDDEDGSSF